MGKASASFVLFAALLAGCGSSDDSGGSSGSSGQGATEANGSGTGAEGTSGTGGVSGTASGGSGAVSGAAAGAGGAAVAGTSGTGGVSGVANGGSGGVSGAAGGSAAPSGGSGAGGAGTSGAGGTVTPPIDGSVGDGATPQPDAAADASVTPPTGSWWKPVAGLSWQWQIGGGAIDFDLPVDVFDIDWEQNASVVEGLHQAGKKVICYISVGSWEDWRPDAASFPASVLGNEYPGWPGERFVDIRAQALRDIMAGRLDVCQSKGFDAVEPDNMDVFGNNSGFPLTRSDGIDYALWLANESHNRGMAIVQKNASEITSSIQSVYDGALTESCYAGGNWCSDMQPYIDADKPVFACEYNSGIFDAACSWGTPRKYSFILKSMNLGAPVTFCP